MSDRHLCKAKRTDNGEWVEGFYVRCRNHDYILPIFNDCEVFYGYDDRYDDFVEVDPSTICQCIGLKDKNDKLIWENDIVTVPEDEEPYLIGWDEDCAKWSMTQYGSNLYDFDNFWSSETEIIGSAIDNPELLEVG